MRSTRPILVAFAIHRQSLSGHSLQDSIFQPAECKGSARCTICTPYLLRTASPAQYDTCFFSVDVRSTPYHVDPDHPHMAEKWLETLGKSAITAHSRPILADTETLAEACAARAESFPPPQVTSSSSLRISSLAPWFVGCLPPSLAFNPSIFPSFF